MWSFRRQAETERSAPLLTQTRPDGMQRLLVQVLSSKPRFGLVIPVMSPSRKNGHEKRKKWNDAVPVGKPCYIQDDQTVTTLATGASVAGLVIRVDNTGVAVEIGSGLAAAASN